MTRRAWKPSLISSRWTAKSKCQLRRLPVSCPAVRISTFSTLLRWPSRRCCGSRVTACSGTACSRSTIWASRAFPRHVSPHRRIAFATFASTPAKYAGLARRGSGVCSCLSPGPSRPEKCRGKGHCIGQKCDRPSQCSSVVPGKGGGRKILCGDPCCDCHGDRGEGQPPASSGHECLAGMPA